MKRILIIDGNLMAHKCMNVYRGLSVVVGDEKVMTGIPYGFVKSVIRLSKIYDPCEMCVVFDSGVNVTISHDLKEETKSKRAEIYPEYKCHRTFKQDLFDGVRLLYRFLKLMNIAIVYPSLAYEADDVIAYIENKAMMNHMKAGDTTEVVVVSNDKDFHQLIKKLDGYQVKMHKNGDEVWDKKRFSRTFGFDPSLSLPYLALLGDKTDGVPGVYGYGKIKSADLVSQYDVDEIVDKLEGHEADIFLRNMALISLYPLQDTVSKIHMGRFDQSKFNLISRRYKMMSFLKREEQEILESMRPVRFLEDLGHDVVSIEA